MGAAAERGLAVLARGAVGERRVVVSVHGTAAFAVGVAAERGLAVSARGAVGEGRVVVSVHGTAAFAVGSTAERGFTVFAGGLAVAVEGAAAVSTEGGSAVAVHGAVAAACERTAVGGAAIASGGRLNGARGGLGRLGHANIQLRLEFFTLGGFEQREKRRDGVFRRHVLKQSARGFQRVGVRLAGGQRGGLFDQARVLGLFDVLARRRLLAQDGGFRHPAVVPHARGFAAHDERIRASLAAGAARAADAVHVVFHVQRQVVVEHGFDVVDVQPARGDVGGHQNAHHAVFEALHDRVALNLAHVAVQPRGGKAARLQLGHDLLHAQLRVHEHQRARDAVAHQKAAQKLHLVERADGNVGLPDGLDGHLFVFDAQNLRLLQIFLGQVQNRERHRGGEQRGLARLRRFGKYAFNVLAEAHVQHFVGLVQHGDFHAVQRQRAAVQVIHHAAGRAHDDLNAHFQRAKLALDRLPAVYGQHVQAGTVFGELDQLARRLHGEFARGADHQRLRRAVGRVDFLDDRYAERGGFAGSGLRLTDHVFALEQRRDGERLNRGRGVVAHVLDGAAGFLRKIKIKMFQRVYRSHYISRKC